MEFTLYISQGYANSSTIVVPFKDPALLRAQRDPDPNLAKKMRRFNKGNLGNIEQSHHKSQNDRPHMENDLQDCHEAALR